MSKKSVRTKTLPECIEFIRQRAVALPPELSGADDSILTHVLLEVLQTDQHRLSGEGVKLLAMATAVLFRRQVDATNLRRMN